MAQYLDEQEVRDAYDEATKEADQWRIDYPEYERLADNGLLADLDENLPEVNDGSLAASLFKLAKRVIKKNLAGRAVALDTDAPWLTELANIIWEKRILPNANSKASPRRKWKDAVRKAAMYGGQPIITLFVTRGNYTGSDFIVPYAQDVKLEAGKDSDEDSDIIFWDVYYTKLQLKNMLEQAKEEQKELKVVKQAEKLEQALTGGVPAKDDFYNKWDLEALQAIIDGYHTESRPGNEIPNSMGDKANMKNGIHFYVAFQRGKDAPFMMCHPGTSKCVREWSNPDPTGDIPVHYLYCYQDFINPYGIGIVKLAGGTQNVLDYMRQADILATQLGLRPPKQIKGDETQVDEDSLVYAQDANWYVGNASVERMEIANGVYTQLPNRMAMYKTSLNQMIPTGDISISGESSGDPNYSKTPAGVKFQQQSLSIDDEDFAENVDECYAAVAKSMINIEFANMQGKDLLKLDDEEREILAKSGVQFPVDETGEPSNELEVVWDQARANFDFEINPDADRIQDEKAALEGKMRAWELAQDPNTDIYMAQDGKRLSRGELLSDIFSTLTDNDKIVQDISPEDQQMQQQQQQMMMAQQQGMPPQEQPLADPSQQAQPEIDEATAAQHIQMTMEAYNVDENTAAAMLEAERQGFPPEQIVEAMQRNQGAPSNA